MSQENMIPEIRISYGQLLAQTVSRELADKFNFKLEDDAVYFDKTLEYWKAWQVKESQILNALQDMLGVTFYLPVIDVTCLPFFIPYSMPVIMNFKEKPERFVDVLTHELCHLILTDNNCYREYEEAPNHYMADDWRKMYGSNHDHTAIVHIPVHAMCKYLWLDVLKEPKRYEHDKQEVMGYHGADSYVKAWEYVDSVDYKRIITQLQKLYTSIKK